ncbi:Serine palmitoyltransferase 2 [Orchesella cincta]|uniref:Serine palmitoyltransferase 2 n=1 Tax=Orchesella cincta TaxID=48709 RepID=A0A1D2MH43_ORCCI|nr:Serine palmitoyltransferase 2 [Orchesella cincta]
MEFFFWWDSSMTFSVRGQPRRKIGYVPLYASFASFYTRHVYRKIRDCWNNPVTSVPGGYITLLERVTKDHGWTFEITDKKVNCINMGSYNYLGFAENHGPCAEAAIEAVKSSGVGTCSSRTEMGNSKVIKELNQLVAKFVGAEAALTCAMGFATNSMNIPAILNRNCLVLSDEKNHASIILGLKLSGAKLKVFKHNDMKSLEKGLRDGVIKGRQRTGLHWDKIFIMVEGVYSMEGTIVNLPEILALKKKYKAYLYLDEAHSVGALGPHGRGVVDYYGCNPKDIDIMMGTFTKSFGSGVATSPDRKP